MELFEPVEGAFNEGGLMDEGGTIDPESGNDVPVGSTQEEVRDDIPAQLSEGEFVLPADVVRYHGLEKIMELRDEAKAGLAKMEAMGQMGNSEEATLPDDVPFSMDDLELEDDGMDFQVGGFVPPPNIGFQQSQFANYQPQISQPVVQPSTVPMYQAPTQQFTPTQTGSVPSFATFTQPKSVTYYHADGRTIQIPVDANGNPLIPVPAGFTATKPTADATAPTTPTTTTAPPPSSSGGGDGGGVITPTPKSDLEKEQDSIKADPRFKDILEEFDNRTGIQKFADTVAGVSPVLSIFGGGTRSKEYAQLEADLVRGVQSVPADQRDELYKELSIATEQAKQGRSPEQGLAPVIDMTTPEARAKLAEEGKLTTSPDQVRQTGVETAQVTKEGQTAAEAAKIERQERGIFGPEGIDDTPEITSEIKGRTTIPADFATTTTRSPTRGAIAADEFVDTQTKDAFDIEQFERGFEPTGERTPSDPTEFSAPSRVEATQRRQDATAAQAQAAAGARREAQPTRTESLESRDDYQNNVSKYESRGYSSSAARSAARNKTRADDEARANTGNPKSTAVTSSSGKAVRSSSGAVVTNTPPEDDGGSEKSIVCTEMYRQTQLDDWAKAMKIWNVYQKKHLTPAHEIGYHWLFKPYVRGMQNSNMLTQIGAYLAQERTKHLKHIMTKGRAKDSLVGNIWCKFIHPIVYVAGRIKNG